MLQHNDKTLIIDTGPDFREQLLRHNVMTIDGILITHGHRDHIAGLDDIRPFNYMQGKTIDLWCDEWGEAMIRDQFPYAFRDMDYEYAPKVKFHRVGQESFTACGLQILPVEVMHYKLPVRGYRIGGLCYITDAKTIAPEEKEKMKGCDTLVVNALRTADHIAHFTLAEALQLIEELKPRVAYLIHMSHQFGLHAEMEKTMPNNVKIAFDNLVLDL